MTIAEFAESVARYGMLTGASVTSWGRTTEHNLNVGGVTYSSHRFWLGCDLVYDEPTLLSMTARMETARRLGLRVIIEGDHDHLQPLDWLAG